MFSDCVGEHGDSDIVFAIDSEEEELEKGIRESMKKEYVEFMRSFYGLEL